MADDIYWQRWVVLAALPVTAFWIAIVASRIGGDWDFLVPAGIGLLLAVAVLISGASLRSSTAMIFLLFLILTVLNYRVRGLPEDENDGRFGQNLIKVAVWACVLVPCLINWRVIIPYCRDGCVATFFAFIMLSVLSTFWSINPSLTFISALGVLTYLMFGCLLAEVIPTHSLVLSVIWISVIYLLANWVFTAFVPDVGLLDTGGLGALLRLQGISGHPNFLGQQAAITLCFVIGAYDRDYISRNVFWTLLICVGMTLLATQSRTSMLALALAYAACRFPRKFITVGIIVLFVFVIILITGYLNEVAALFIRQGDGDVLAGRGAIWDYLGPKIAAHPWQGYGFNVFERYYEYDHPNMLDPASPLAGMPIPSHPHNSYLEVLFSGGILTLISFLALTFLIIIRWLIRPNMLRDITLMWLFFGSMTEVNLAGPPGMITLLGCMAIAMSHRPKAISQEAHFA